MARNFCYHVVKADDHVDEFRDIFEDSIDLIKGYTATLKRPADAIPVYSKVDRYFCTTRQR